MNGNSMIISSDGISEGTINPDDSITVTPVFTSAHRQDLGVVVRSLVMMIDGSHEESLSRADIHALLRANIRILQQTATDIQPT